MPNGEEGLTSLEALGIAIRTETDARDVYRELSQRCERPLVSRRFEHLAAEEEQHRHYLLARWEEVSGGVLLKLPPSGLPEEMRTPESRCVRSVEDVLDSAIEAKRRARDFYLLAARETDDLSGREMFQYLADMEYRHLAVLSEERDLLARYPKYHGSSDEPWRAEPSFGREEEGR